MNPLVFARPLVVEPVSVAGRVSVIGPVSAVVFRPVVGPEARQAARPCVRRRFTGREGRAARAAAARAGADDRPVPVAAVDVAEEHHRGHLHAEAELLPREFTLADYGEVAHTVPVRSYAAHSLIVAAMVVGGNVGWRDPGGIRPGRAAVPRRQSGVRAVRGHARGAGRGHDHFPVRHRARPRLRRFAGRRRPADGDRAAERPADAHGVPVDPRRHRRRRDHRRRADAGAIKGWPRLGRGRGRRGGRSCRSVRRGRAGGRWRRSRRGGGRPRAAPPRPW